MVFLILGMPSWPDLHLKSTLILTAVPIKKMEMMIWQLMEIRGRALFQFSIGVFVRKASYLEMDDSENEKSECSENRFYTLAFMYKNNCFFLQWNYKKKLYIELRIHRYDSEKYNFVKIFYSLHIWFGLINYIKNTFFAEDNQTNIYEKSLMPICLHYFTFP